MTVGQYVTNFLKLSQHAPYVIDTLMKKNRRFINRLQTQLQHSLIPFNTVEFDRVMDLAVKFEEQNIKFRENRDKGKAKIGKTSKGSGFQYPQCDQNRGHNCFRPYDEKGQ